MKTQREIQKAHDLIRHYIETGEAMPGRICPVTHAAVHAAADVLCWVLGHADNKAFEANMARMRELMAKANAAAKNN